uniref:Uncharacterized protein n=1 Tax=viral metagenome TaxID=1070528 RepID=A0A6M3IEC3_9ZZZZ
MPEDPQEIARWWQYHHCQPCLYPAKDGDGFRLGVKVPLTCQHLEWQDGVTSCAIYETRPKVCQDYFCPEVRNGPGV